MNISEQVKIKPQVHELSTFKQIMESRTHPLDMLREAISNMMAPEVKASHIKVQHYIHPDFNSSFTLIDDGIGMTYTGNKENPGRLDRFIGVAFSKAAGISSDYWGWKGLGSKLMLNCGKLLMETWTGNEEEPYLSLQIIAPRYSLLADPPVAPEYFLSERKALKNDQKGTRIEILGYDSGKKTYSMNEIKQYLYWNTAIGITNDIHHTPMVSLKVNSEEEVLSIGYKFIVSQHLEDGKVDWRTVVINPPITKSIILPMDKEISVTLKGGFTLDTGRFNLSPYRYNTGLRLSVKGIPYFQLPFYEYKGNKFQQYKDLCSFVIECDAMESKLNLDRSNLSNHMGDDEIVKTFKILTTKCFDQLTESATYTEFIQNSQKENERDKASAVRDRQKYLNNPNQEYVCIQDGNEIKTLHRIPDSEIQTLCVFWKLEAINKLPFENFITWEHTAKNGIDVIASYQIDDQSALENFVPIEFETLFGNFIKHGHNPKQTKCIICWEINKKNLLRKVNDYFSFYDIDGISIPVYEIKSFPGLIIKKFSEIS